MLGAEFSTNPKITVLSLYKNGNIKNVTFQFASSYPTYYPETDKENRDSTQQDILLLAYVVDNKGAKNVRSAHNYASGNLVLYLWNAFP